MMKISTHTLTWSVTLNFGQNVTVYVISTHTLTWSVTSAVCYAWFIWEISTHTLTWSVTPFFTRSNVTMSFQLTRSRGA